MFLFFNSKDVYIGYSLEELAKVRECLAANRIKYSYNVVSHPDSNRGRNGSFGIDPDYEKMYYVKVKNSDYDRASYLVYNALHRL